MADQEQKNDGTDDSVDRENDDDQNKGDKNKSSRSGDDKGGDDNNKPDPKDDLAPIKEKLNKAFEERDSAKEQLKQLQDKLRQQEIDHLKEQGKEVEALEKKVEQRDSRIAELESEVTRLSRDVTVRDEFRGHAFRNERASELAYETVIKDLIQDDKGRWVHKSGKSISDYIKTFSEDEDNQFLFAPKTNRGTGTGSRTTNRSSDSGSDSGNDDNSSSLFKRSQADVLKDIKAGKIRPKGQPAR